MPTTTLRVLVWRVLIAIIVAWPGAPQRAAAQDVQYWNSTYGTKALLLGGIVIGSVQDISAVYYNPAGLALLERTEVILSGSGYQYAKLSLENNVGAQGTLASSSLSAIPGMFAGEIPSKSLKTRFGYSVLTRQRFNSRVEGRGLAPDTALGAGNLDFFSGDLHGEENLSETWVGLTLARLANPHFAFGITQFGVVRSQHARFTLSAQALDTNGLAAIAIRSRDFEYSSWGLLWKAGIGIRFQPWSLGLTVTTPTVHVFGSGSSGKDLTTVDQGIAAGSITQVATDFQDGVGANYKTPLSVGLGGAYGFGPTRLHASAEWFASQDAYQVLETQPFTAQSSGEMFTNQVVQQFESVVNYGVGIEHHFGAKRAAYASFRTDRSPVPDSSAANATLSRWDLTHVTGGAAFTLLHADLVLGGDVAWGSRAAGPATALSPDDPGIPTSIKIGYTSFTIFFAVKVAFGATH